MENELDSFIDAFKYESYTEWGDVIKDEIIKIIKKYNVLSWYGKNWYVITSIDPISDIYTFDVRTVKSYWRVLKIQK